MSDVEEKVQIARNYHNHGYNCAQSVSCAFCQELGMDEETMFRITEGLGLGMGSMDGTCGAIGAAAILSGLKNSTAHLEHPDSKSKSYRAMKSCMDAFKEQNGSVICRDLKGIGTGKVLRTCDGCVEDAVRLVAAKIFEDEDISQ